MARIRLTEAQFALFSGRASEKGGAANTRTRRPRAELPENVIESQIKAFLAARGWFCIRQHVGTFAPYRVLMAMREKTMSLDQALRNIVRIGQKGDADWIAIRPIGGNFGKCDVFFWECKAPGKKARPEQLEFQRRMQAAGFESKIFDDYSLQFAAWYARRYEGAK